MSMKEESLIERARRKQERIESKFHNAKFSDSEFFKFLFFIFFFTGFGITFYCFVFGINPLLLSFGSDPFLYFGIGFICFFWFLYSRNHSL